MKAILVFIDGTTCDMRHRIPFQGTEQFFAEANIKKDKPTLGSVECMKELAKKYHLIYIGDRWDDNELHLELGAKSFILQEWTPNWETVRKYI